MVSAYAQVGHDRTGRTQLAQGQKLAQPVGGEGGGRGNLFLAIGNSRAPSDPAVKPASMAMNSLRLNPVCRLAAFSFSCFMKSSRCTVIN